MLSSNGSRLKKNRVKRFSSSQVRRCDHISDCPERSICMRAVSVFLALLALLLNAPTQPVRAEQRDPGKSQERLEFLTMWKIMEALDLDKATGDKIWEIRKKSLVERKALQSSLYEDFRNLKRILKDTPRGQENDKELTDILASIREKRRRLQALGENLYDELSKVLTVRQRAELVVFLKDFRKEMREMLRPLGPPGGPSPASPHFNPRMEPPGGGLPPKPGAGFPAESHGFEDTP
jgi:Spy/CpxP family protein refolding chaperone